MPSMKKNAVCVGIGQLFNKLVKEIGSPVDFELPESYNKLKSSSSYSNIRRNVYLTKKIKRRLEDDGIFCSCCSSAGSDGVCGKDCLCSKEVEYLIMQASLWEVAKWSILRALHPLPLPTTMQRQIVREREEFERRMQEKLAAQELQFTSKIALP